MSQLAIQTHSSQLPSFGSTITCYIKNLVDRVVTAVLKVFDSLRSACSWQKNPVKEKVVALPPPVATVEPPLEPQPQSKCARAFSYVMGASGLINFGLNLTGNRIPWFDQANTVYQLGKLTIATSKHAVKSVQQFKTNSRMANAVNAAILGINAWFANLLSSRLM